jgi:hypothetical protein
MVSQLVRRLIQFDPATDERLRKMAFKERISVAKLVRRLVSVGLKTEEMKAQEAEAESAKVSRLLKAAGIKKK